MPRHGPRDLRPCPNCGKRIYRVKGDRFLHCYSCGNTEGIPVVRWLTHSPLSKTVQRRLRRIMNPSKPFKTPIVVLWFLLGVITTMYLGGVTAADLQQGIDERIVGPVAPDARAGSDSGNTTTTLTTTTTSSDLYTEPDPNVGSSGAESVGTLYGYDQVKIERAIHTLVNDRRQNNPIRYDSHLSRIARYHSWDMAENDYYSHYEPNSDRGPLHRYDRFGYDCDSGSENIVKMYLETRVEYPNEGMVAIDSEEEIAEYAVRAWMNSDGHRANMLDSGWRNEGVGVWITTQNGTKVAYITQNFC